MKNGKWRWTVVMLLWVAALAQELRHDSPNPAFSLQSVVARSFLAFPNQGTKPDDQSDEFTGLTALGAIGELTSKRAHTVSFPLYGIDFSPYENGQDPNNNSYVGADQITARLQIIAPYTQWVRSFSMTTGLENIPPIARSFGLKVAAGAWISTNLTQNAQEITNLIAAANAGNVDIAVVGSEVLLRGDVSESQLISYMTQVRQAIPANIPVTTADTYGVLLNHPNVIAASDVILGNFYPYWEGQSINNAVCALVAEYSELVNAAGGKQVIVSETGWPSGGNAVGAAVPSPANAAQFFLQFVTWARSNNVAFLYFEAFNEEWKAKYEGPQGAYWGIWDEYGVLKPWMQPVFDGQTEPINCNGIPCGGGNPTISYTFVPPYGDSNDLLEGQECNVAPASYGVAVYIQVNGGWWTKPYWASPVTPLNADGSWTCNIVTGGEDQLATQIASFLIPNNYSPPLLGGQSNLPNELYQNSVANVQTVRSPNQSISGQVTTGGYPLPGVTITLTGAEQGMTQTAPDGKYSFPNLSTSGPYTVTPSSAQYSFNPSSQTFQNIVGNQIANFTGTPVAYVLSVLKTGTGSGTVTSNDGTINCGAICSYNYNSGTQVTLTATPSQGSSLTSWGGCDTIQNNLCTVTMNSGRSVTANFDLAAGFDLIHSFVGSNDGAVPYAGLTMDQAGNLYGTTFGLGSGYGTVFRLKRTAGGWIFNPLYSFTGGSDGAGPEARVVFGPDGSLYGTTTFGGGGSCTGVFDGCGTIFRLRPPATACKSALCPWTETVLYRFSGGSDGLYPMYGALVFDQAGNIYGTTYAGGVHAGTVYELTPANGGWTESVLYNFTGGTDGGLPFAGVIFDKSGNLYGTTVGGGQQGCEVGCGTVFQLTPLGSSWTENVLYTFQGGNDGGGPYAGLVLDNTGNLYGATALDGSGGGGTVFELTPTNGNWVFTLAYSLIGYDGGPHGNLIRDGAGNLYGTTLGDGAYGWGNVFRLTPGTGGWTYDSLYDFTGGNDGAQPYGSLVFDSNGNLYGAASYGGTNSKGVVFEITP